MKKVKSQKLNVKGQRGFTLIELLTVISIIGILTALLTASFIGVRQRARDAQRKSDIKQLQSAMELYRADNDSYPSSATFQTWTCGNPVMSGGGITYMAKMPCDPANNHLYYYYSLGSTTTYDIASCLENTGDKDAVLGDSTHEPSWWLAAAAWPPNAGTCTSTPGYYYTTSNP